LHAIKISADCVAQRKSAERNCLDEVDGTERIAGNENQQNAKGAYYNICIQ